MRRIMALVFLLSLLAHPAHAATFFDDSFETCTVGTGNDFPCEGWNDFGQESASRFSVSTENPFSGTKSLKQVWIDPAGSTTIPQPSIYKNLPSPQEHLFLRFANRRMPGWVQSTNGVTKRVIIGNLGYPRTMIHDYFNSYAIGIECPYNVMNPSTGAPFQSLFWSSGVTPSATGFDQLEFEGLLNTPGQANGVMRLWVNGVLKIEKLNLELRGPTPTSVGQCGPGVNASDYKFRTVQLFTQSGKGDWYTDRFAAGDTRIGLVGSQPTTAQPPITPLNFMVKP